MVALPTALGDALAAALEHELGALASLLRLRLPSWRWESVTLEPDAPRTIQMLWHAVGWNDRLRDAMLAPPDRAHAERVLRAHDVDRIALPSRTRLAHVDDAGLVLTDEDTPRDDPSLVAWLRDEGRVLAQAASYLRWCTAALVRCAFQPWYRTRLTARTPGWDAAVRPLPIAGPTCIALSDACWRIPVDPDERAVAPGRIELAHRDFAGLVGALLDIGAPVGALAPSREGERVDTTEDLAGLRARHPTLVEIGPGIAAGTVDALSVVVVEDDGACTLTTDAGSGERLRTTLGSP